MGWVWAHVRPAVPVLPSDDHGREERSGNNLGAADSAVERPTDVPTEQVQYIFWINHLVLT